MFYLQTKIFKECLILSREWIYDEFMQRGHSIFLLLATTLANCVVSKHTLCKGRILSQKFSSLSVGGLIICKCEGPQIFISSFSEICV